MTLGDIIKSYRDENKVSMEYVANLCGITKGYVAMLEKNINSKTGRPVKPTIETIVKVCNGLHLDFNSVFDSLDDDYEINISPSPSSSSAPELELTEQEARLVGICRSLNEEGRERLVEYGDDLVASGKYIKRTSEYRPVSPIPEKQKAVEDAYKKVLGNVNAKEVEYGHI